MAGRLHRKLKHHLTLTCQALALLVAVPAYAARPFVTDDARIVEHCQVETFYKEQRNYSGSEFWFLPACNAFGFEITIGGNRIEGDHNEILQTKFLLKPLEPNGIGYAVSLGWFGGDPYFNAITSKSFLDDRLVVHANLGSFRDAGGVWGLGLEALLLRARADHILRTGRHAAVNRVHARLDSQGSVSQGVWLRHFTSAGRF